jgi:hypothetical protein
MVKKVYSFEEGPRIFENPFDSCVAHGKNSNIEVQMKEHFPLKAN